VFPQLYLLLIIESDLSNFIEMELQLSHFDDSLEESFLGALMRVMFIAKACSTGSLERCIDDRSTKLLSLRLGCLPSFIWVAELMLLTLLCAAESRLP